jgi:hypothetical protein
MISWEFLRIARVPVLSVFARPKADLISLCRFLVWGKAKIGNIFGIAKKFPRDSGVPALKSHLPWMSSRVPEL